MMRLIGILGNRNAGFVLGMVVVLNLALGSLAMDRFPEIYPPFFPNDLGFFFDPVRVEHGWLYLLLVSFTLFSVNLIACILDTVVGMAQARTARLKPLAALLFHVALVVIVLAHLYDGVYGDEYRVALDDQPTALPGIGKVRVEGLQRHYHPDGSMKETEVDLWFTLDDGRELRRRIAYNEPALFAGGTRAILIQQGDHQASGVIVTRLADGAALELLPYVPQRIGGGHLALRGVTMSELDVPLAQLLWIRKDGHYETRLMVLDTRAAAHAEIEIAGERFRYQGPVLTPVAYVMVRYNPAIPMVLAGLLLTTLATILLIVWQRRRA